MFESRFYSYAVSGEFFSLFFFYALAIVFFNSGIFFGKSFFVFRKFKGVNLSQSFNLNILFLMVIFYFISSVAIYSAQVPFTLFDILTGKIGNAYVLRQMFIEDVDNSVRSLGFIYILSVNIKSLVFLPVVMMIFNALIKGYSSKLLSMSIIIFLLSFFYGGLLKGATKEFFDMLFISFFFYLALKGNKLYLKIVPLIGVVILTVFLFNQFLRLGDVDFFDFINSVFILLVEYLSQGYIGLSNVMWVDNLGYSIISHLSVLNNILIGNGLIDNSFTLDEKLISIGWKSGQYWSTMYSSLVSDFGWLGVFIYLFFIGLLLGISINSMKHSLRVYPLTIAMFCVYVVFFSSMNFQVGLNIHWLIMYVFIFFTFPITVKLNKIR